MSNIPTPPPVPASQRYPVQIRNFVSYADQPPDPNDPKKTFTVSNPDGTTTAIDLTLDSAIVTRDLHTEIVSMEQTVGQKPFLVGGTMGSSIQFLHQNKATIGHNHLHQAMYMIHVGDDHPQYMTVDGSKAFTAPVTAPGAVAGTHLINLSQAKVAGLNRTQVEAIIQSQLKAKLANLGDDFVRGPVPGQRWKMTGGFTTGYTDENGNIWVDFTPARFSEIISFIYMKNPFPGGSMLGWYAYQYMEDQLVLLGLSPQGAMIQFIEDIRVDRQALVALTWIALGI